jgi:hypothetical protein
MECQKNFALRAMSITLALNGSLERVRFELERTRILVRVNGWLAGFFFIKNDNPYLHLLNDSSLTAGIEYYVSRVLSASWGGVSLHLATKT